jgi:hypothetical protein
MMYFPKLVLFAVAAACLTAVPGVFGKEDNGARRLGSSVHDAQEAARLLQSTDTPTAAPVVGTEEPTPFKELIPEEPSGLLLTELSVERFNSTGSRKLLLNEHPVDEDDNDRRLQGQSTLTVRVKHDNYPQEVAWQVERWNGAVVGIQTRGSVLTPGRLVSRNYGLGSGTYYFEITDSGYDGICCVYGNGFYELYIDGTLIFRSLFLDGFGERVTFTLA